jgi:hypothetical protein
MGEGVWKNINMLYSMTDNSTVSKDRPVRLALLERAFRAANSANVGFSTHGSYMHFELET